MRQMSRTMVMIAAAGLASGVTAAPVLAADGGRPISVQMTGAAERPGPGDADGVGTATFRINPGQERVCYTLSVTGIAPATAAHVHRAPADVAGPVEIPLAPPTDGTSEGCAEVTRELALELIRDPEAFYVNVHNADFPAGAIRAQLG